MDEKRRIESGFDVEELGCGFVKYDNGLTMDILESWAINAGEFPPSMIAGSTGGLSINPFEQDPNNALVYYSEMEGYPTATSIDVRAEQYRKRKIDPSLEAFNHPQSAWVAALRAEAPWPVTAETALSAMLISEGIYMSSESGREVTRDEIVSNSKSRSFKSQETPFGIIEY
jgi:predicted dehydrogenase